MNNALYISAVGLQAQKEQLDAAAVNFANVNTVAFKRQVIDFSSVLDRMPAHQTATPLRSAPSSMAGNVMRVDLAQGELRETGRALDVAISGAGFIEVDLGDGVVGYSRGGSLQLSDDGTLTVASGAPLKADIRVPRGATALQVHADGSVTAVLDNQGAAAELGRIELATFVNPESLAYQGEGVFVTREGVAEPLRGKPGEGGTGRLAGRTVEGSNVRMIDELVSLMLVQRVYELNAKVVQAADEMAGLTNNLRRG